MTLFTPWLRAGLLAAAALAAPFASKRRTGLIPIPTPFHSRRSETVRPGRWLANCSSCVPEPG
jgi:hypothetical protein